MLWSYFYEMYIDSVYISKSPNFRDTRLRLYLDKISELKNGGISDEEIEYLNRVQVNYNIVLDEIDGERDKNIINRMFGVLNHHNAMKLVAVFEEFPEKR